MHLTQFPPLVVSCATAVGMLHNQGIDSDSVCCSCAEFLGSICTMLCVHVCVHPCACGVCIQLQALLSPVWL